MDFSMALTAASKSTSHIVFSSVWCDAPQRRAPKARKPLAQF
jgi:hypothetical protein